MDTVELRNKVKELSPWWENIKLTDEVATTDGPASKDYLYGLVEPFLPPLENARILDIGSNACGWPVELAKHGAKDITVVERSEHYVRQGKFIKDFFNFDISINRYNLLDHSVEENIEKFGKFDIVCCFGVLYHLMWEDVIKMLANVYEMSTSKMFIGTHTHACSARPHLDWVVSRENVVKALNQVGYGNVVDISIRPHGNIDKCIPNDWYFTIDK
jgi:2-polyprenyl-3-methyl-5-hydroxy-6-metoxy-1,4-benzoquinol methylase